MIMGEMKENPLYNGRIFFPRRNSAGAVGVGIGKQLLP